MVFFITNVLRLTSCSLNIQKFLVDLVSGTTVAHEQLFDDVAGLFRETLTKWPRGLFLTRHFSAGRIQSFPRRQDRFP